MSSPPLSVVMGVYNGGKLVADTVNSILQQTFTEFELIIVDDGSTDDTGSVLQRLASEDPRIVVLTQENAGLTRALIRGCEAARGEFIARHDVGDRSLPFRFQKQIDLLNADSEVVAVGGGLRRIGPCDEFLGDTVRKMRPDEITADFLENGIGLSHPASMFRTQAFRDAGGYRKEFRFAQDTDLWYRISRHGKLAEVDAVLVELRIDTDGISPQNSDRQQLLADLGRASYDKKLAGENDASLLAQAQEVSWGELAQQNPRSRSVAKSNAEHFIGSQLYALGDKRCRRYFMRAIRQRPFWVRPWLKLLLSFATTSDVSGATPASIAQSTQVDVGPPKFFAKTIHRLGQTARLLGGRARALKYAIAGVTTGKKVSLGKNTRIEYPWRVSIGSRATFEQDVWLKLVDDHATIQIGEFTFIGRGSELDVAQHVRIGANVLIAPRVFITDHSHNIAPGQTIGTQGCESHMVTIGDDVWIGTAAVILPGVTIGNGAVIGAGAIVRSDVPEYEIWAGVPAKRIRSR